MGRLVECDAVVWQLEQLLGDDQWWAYLLRYLHRLHAAVAGVRQGQALHTGHGRAEWWAVTCLVSCRICVALCHQLVRRGGSHAVLLLQAGQEGCEPAAAAPWLAALLLLLLQCSLGQA